MFIREFKIVDKKTKNTTLRYAIVSNSLVDSKVKQTIILYLGADFTLEKSKWPMLIDRIDSILNKQQILFEISDEIELLAQSLAIKIIEARLKKQKLEFNQDDYFFRGLLLLKSPSVGTTALSLWALYKLGFPFIFKRIGLTKTQRLIAYALIVARMEHPDSELETVRWLSEDSSLCYLLGIEFDAESTMPLHRISDKIISNKKLIEQIFIEYNKNIFNNSTNILYYDLTNTYFEGNPQVEKAKRGFSKEKRFDCKLISLAATIDTSGYVVHSEIYPGNVSEPTTFEQMVSQIIHDKNIILIMDRGIATAANIALAHKLGIKYIAANRELRREFDQSRAIEFKTRSGSTVYFYKEEVDIAINNEEVREVRLSCLSEGRKFKEEGMNASRKKGYESGLMNLANQIKKGVSPMNESEVYKRIGAFNSKYGVSRHYDVKTVNSETETVRGGPLVTDLKFEFKPLPYTKMSDPGVYNIRTNALDLSAQEIFTSYNDLTRIESSFRSFKSELGFRPIYHKKDERIDGHLFITILAYQCVTWIRNQLKSANKNYSWKTIRNKLSSLAISEIKYHTPNGNTVKLQCGVIYEQHKEIFDAVGFIYNKLNTLDFTFLKNI